jgi:enterochelin esterase-like enzyme
MPSFPNKIRFQSSKDRTLCTSSIVGGGKDVALTGDLIGWRYDQPMHHVDGTDLYYYSKQLESDARVTYRFTRDLQKAITDTLNPRVHRTRWFGRSNWFQMPDWHPPAHLENHELAAKGRIDTLEFKTQIRDDSLSIPVYLPAEYESSSTRYPVVYFHEGDLAQSKGQLQQSLDYLLGRDVEPVIVVFVPRLLQGGSRYLGAQGDKYLTAFVDELIPAVDQKYRTWASREMRANMGCGFQGGFLSYIATIKKPGAVGKLAVQSMWWDSREDENVRNILPSPSEYPLSIYIAWGRYDLHSPLEGAANIKKSTRRGAELLTEAGYKYEGGEFNGGHGWHSWKTRTDKMFETLFPLQQ